MKELNWVSLGCGVIAHQLAQAMQKDGRKLYGVANRTYSKAIDFAKEYGLKRCMKISMMFLKMRM